MDLIVQPIHNLLFIVISLYTWVVVAYVVLSWLQAFGVVDSSNQFVHAANNFFNKVVDPVLSKIRKLIPSVGGLDISPILLFLALHFLQNFIGILATKLTYGI